jgi:flavodoxin
MKKATIIFHSKTGITKKYAQEIAAYLNDRGISIELVSIQEYTNGLLQNSDTVFLGCWTIGLMLFLQHPDKTWAKFASAVPSLKEKKVILFTTYKLATGSMFKKMRKHLDGKISAISAELKSKNGTLSEIDRIILDDLVQRI